MYGVGHVREPSRVSGTIGVRFVFGAPTELVPHEKNDDNIVDSVRRRSHERAEPGQRDYRGTACFCAPTELYDTQGADRSDR